VPRPSAPAPRPSAPTPRPAQPSASSGGNRRKKNRR
jgi:hypothetical protein